MFFASFRRLALGGLLASLPVIAQAQSSYATPYATSTFAGSAPLGNWDGVGTSARFGSPNGSAFDSSGNLFVADGLTNTIRKITPAGVVTTFVGTAGTAGFDDGTGAAARFSGPFGLTIDTANNLYVVDRENKTIRKITPAGVVTTLAGSPSVAGTADGTGSAARFTRPTYIAIDSAGNLFVTDSDSFTVRKITPTGTVSTFAGTPGVQGTNSGTGSAALFGTPGGIAIDSSNTIYVADYGFNTVRKITPGAVVSNFVGQAGAPGSADGTGSAARFTNPGGLATDGAGNVYVTDFQNNNIRKVTPAGVVTTLAGLAGTVGSADGAGTAARFFQPQAIAVDSAGSLFVSDTDNGTLRKVTSAGLVTTFAGANVESGSVNGTGTAARFDGPFDAAVTSDGTVYVSDSINHTIRKITAAGVVTTFAGEVQDFGSNDGTGSAARFNDPSGIAVDSTGNVYVTDRETSIIRKITPAGVVTTLAGLAGNPGTTDGTGSAARFNKPVGITVDSTGNVYVADTGNSSIRRITPAGVVTTVVSTGLNVPRGIDIDSAGNLYVADTGNFAVKKITTPGGTPAVTVLAGTVGAVGFTDGTGAAARFDDPRGLAVDSAGNVYVTDANLLLRRITAGGVVTTLAGLVDVAGITDGIGNASRFAYPEGVAVGPNGVLYVVDYEVGTIRKAVNASGAASITNSPASQSPTAGGSTTLSVTATGSGTVTYQWQRNGVDIPGATNSTYTIPSTQSFHAGTYTVVVTANGIATTSDPALVTVNAAPASTARLLNLSTRALSQTGSNALIPGFVLQGAGSRQLLIRAVGPTLSGTPFNVPGVLADPQITLRKSTTPPPDVTVATNDDWSSASNASAILSSFTTVGAFPLPNPSKDAALLVSLTAGGYTAATSGTNNGTGVAIVELYDVNNTGPALVNVSNRGFVSTGSNIMIPGFVVSNEGSRTFLIRVVGPTLSGAPFNVAGTLADPVLTVFRGSEAILTNDDWGSGADAAATAATSVTVGAFNLPSGSKDAAFVVTLPPVPGGYTVQATGKNGTEGVAIVEVYLVP